MLKGAHDSVHAAACSGPKVEPAQYKSAGFRTWFGRGTTVWMLPACALAVAVIQVWPFRYQMGADGVSYVDMADAFLRRDWSMAVNGYWSPGYPLLLAAASYVFRPSPYFEFAVVQGVNVAMYLFALAGFEFFLKRWVATINIARTERGRGALSTWPMRLLGYSLFVYSSLRWIPVQRAGPDLLTAGFVYFLVALLLRIQAEAASFVKFAVLGALLGLAYLSKAVMFPLAFVFLAVAFFAVRNRRLALPRTLLAMVIFALVAAPWVGLLSRAKGRLTFGDSGKINYAHHVAGIFVLVHWQGEGDVGTPKHPTRRILQFPPTYEFAAPVGGTYPPWYDPSYWYDGVSPTFNLKKQLRQLRIAISDYLVLFLNNSELLAGLAALILFGRRGNPCPLQLRRLGPLLLPATAALTLYGAVLEHPRLIGVWVVLLWMAILAYALMQPRLGHQPAKVVMVSMLLVLGARIALHTGANVARALARPSHLHWEIADSLQRMGIKPGDPVASIGSSFGHHWARLARVRIIAETDMREAEPTGFWWLPAETQAEALRAMEEVGAKAVVSKPLPKPLPDFIANKGWRQIGKTGYWVYLLRPRER